MIAFNLLQDFQIKFGLLTLEEEKQKIVPASSAQTGEFTGLGYQFVLVSPVSFSLNNNVLKALKDHQKDLSKLQKLPSVFDNEERFISKIEKALNITLDLPQKLHLLESAAHPNSLKTYWDALRIIAYHSFKNRHIIQKDGTLLPLKTKRQFDYFFHQNTTIDRIRYEDNDPESEYSGSTLSIDPNQREVELCFNGAEEKSFEEFHEYVRLRICGRLDRQIKRKDTAPLLVWRERFKNELTVFFKAKIGGKGYANDYQDSKVRELQRAGKTVHGLDEAALVKQAFMKAIDSGDFSHQEYTCMIACNRGYSYLAISRFTGISKKEVEHIIHHAIPRIVQLIYSEFRKKMKTRESKEGYAITEKLVKQILLQQTDEKSA